MSAQIAFSLSVGGVVLHQVTPSGRCDTNEVLNFSHGATQLVSEDAVIDGDDIRLHGRGGRKFVIRFTGVVYHASNSAAASFVCTHPDAPPLDGGAVALTAGGGAVSYTHGIVTRIETKQQDTVTYTDYEILCSKSGA